VKSERCDCPCAPSTTRPNSRGTTRPWCLRARVLSHSIGAGRTWQLKLVRPPPVCCCLCFLFVAAFGFSFLAFCVFSHDLQPFCATVCPCLCPCLCWSFTITCGCGARLSILFQGGEKAARASTSRSTGGQSSFQDLGGGRGGCPLPPPPPPPFDPSAPPCEWAMATNNTHAGLTRGH
jgi:hypothetical protein